jgi:hypothetical protein
VVRELKRPMPHRPECVACGRSVKHRFEESCWTHDQPLCSAACFARMDRLGSQVKVWPIERYDDDEEEPAANDQHVEIVYDWCAKCRRQAAAAIRKVIGNTSRAPDAIIATGTGDAPRVLRSVDGTVMSVDDLISLCEVAPLGRGSETILDSTKRRVLRVADKASVRVEWDGLEHAAREAARTLLPGAKFRAELHDVLVYREGDFFVRHRDAVKGTGHIATLSAVVAVTEDFAGGDGHKLMTVTWISTIHGRKLVKLAGRAGPAKKRGAGQRGSPHSSTKWRH